MIRSYKAYESFQTEKERSDRISELKEKDMDIKFNTNVDFGADFESVYLLEYIICKSN
jgi:hypothetical protein